MDRQALRERLMGTFLGELEEHVQTLTRDLLALELADPASQRRLVEALFRSAHSLKGAARAVGVQPIEIACHRLESLLARARDGRTVLAADTIQLLLTVSDALADAGARLRDQGDPAAGPLLSLLPAMDRAAAVERAPEGQPDLPVPEAAPPAADRRRPMAERLARVPVEKLDRLLDASGEFLVTRRRTAAGYEQLAAVRDDLRRWRSEWARIEPSVRALLTANRHAVPPGMGASFERLRERCTHLERRLEMLTTRLLGDAHEFNRAARALEDEIRLVRMFPFGQACDGLPRTVRDLAVAGGKQVQLWVEGGDVELGRFVLERLRNPLLHLVRNAVDHGVEPPAERRAAGKPAEATLRVSATLRGDGAEIVVADDGRGLDLEGLRARARERGLPVTGADREDVRLVFASGVSTAPRVTELSGRGVGLEIVRHEVEALHGHVEIASAPGHGTRVVMTVPATVATIRALIVGAAGQTFALPVVSVQHLARIGVADITRAADRQMLIRNGATVPLVSLTEVLGILPPPAHRRHHRVPVVILAAGDRTAAFVVDELTGEDEVLVKTLGARLQRLRHVSGATLLATGQVALILNAAELVEIALTRAGTSRALDAGDRQDRPRRRLLVVDDSVTTRTLERSILEAAGYEVLVAADGRDAWNLLQDQRIDLVVADVEMPRMDGIALCEAMRRSSQLRDVPVVLVTALETPRDRMRGLEAGANAYVPKSSFDQQTLLDTVADLL